MTDTPASARTPSPIVTATFYRALEAGVAGNPVSAENYFEATEDALTEHYQGTHRIYHHMGQAMIRYVYGEELFRQALQTPDHTEELELLRRANHCFTRADEALHGATPIGEDQRRTLAWCIGRIANQQARLLTAWNIIRTPDSNEPGPYMYQLVMGHYEIADHYLDNAAQRIDRLNNALDAARDARVNKQAPKLARWAGGIGLTLLDIALHRPCDISDALGFARQRLPEIMSERLARRSALSLSD